MVALTCPETDGPNGPRKEREAHVPRYASIADSPPAVERPTAAAADTVSTHSPASARHVTEFQS